MAISSTVLEPADTQAVSFSHNTLLDDDAFGDLIADAADAATSLQEFFGAYIALETLAEGRSNKEIDLVIAPGDLHALLNAINEKMAEHVRHTHALCQALMEALSGQAAARDPGMEP